MQAAAAPAEPEHLAEAAEGHGADGGVEAGLALGGDGEIQKGEQGDDVEDHRLGYRRAAFVMDQYSFKVTAPRGERREGHGKPQGGLAHRSQLGPQTDEFLEPHINHRRETEHQQRDG